MADKTTVALTQTQFEEVIRTMKAGTASFRPNERVAAALTIQANLGMRIGDILRLRPADIIRDGSRYRLNDFVESKTRKTRSFTIPTEIYNYLRIYMMDNGIRDEDRFFPITVRAVQKHLKKVCDYLGPEYTKIGTHSFRKFFATEIYKNNNHDIVLVQKLLQHASASITQRYIGISEEEIETAIQNHVKLV